MALLGTASAANAQAIDMSKAHSATISKPAVMAPATTDPLAPHHARVPVWTRMVATHDAQGNLQAMCTVEPRPGADKAHTPSTDTLPTDQ